MDSTSTLPAELLLHIQKDTDISAPVAIVWESLLEQVGSGFEKSDGTPLPMKFEAWPGGRWYRDLGNNARHFWGHVQVIKPPTLLEIVGPMFMSYAVASHAQYRLTEQGRGTRLTLIHRAIADIPADQRAGMNKGWEYIVNKIKTRAER